MEVDRRAIGGRRWQSSPEGTLPGARPLTPESPWWHLTWFLVVATIAFLVPYILTSLVDINHDLYLGTYFAAALAVLAAYVTMSSIDVMERLRTRWQWSIGIGVVAAAFVVWNVLARNDSTAHPGGLYFAFEIAWRGVLYGVVDALLLGAFPGLVALGLMHGDLAGARRRLEYAVLALALTLVVTGVYHAGYAEYRDGDIRQPETGNTVISLPTVLTANPVGSVIAHTSMHVAAVTHAYETDVFLPPQANAD